MDCFEIIRFGSHGWLMEIKRRELYKLNPVVSLPFCLTLNATGSSSVCEGEAFSRLRDSVTKAPYQITITPIEQGHLQMGYAVRDDM